MAAIAYPVQSMAPRRSGAVKTRRPGRDRVRSSHLRLVQEPLFTEPIFEELEADGELIESEWSVWQHPLPVIARHQIVATFAPVDLEAFRPTPLRRFVEPQVALPVVPQEVVHTHPSAHRASSTTSPRYRLRRFVSCVAFGLALFGGLSGASALANTHQGAPVAIAGGVSVSGGYRYTVKAGDTLWSIASRVFPSGDPRALVAELAAQINSTTAVPGEHLLLP